MIFVHGDNNNQMGRLLADEYKNLSGFEVDGNFSILGWAIENDIKAMVVFNDFNGSNIEGHIYAPGYFNRQVIKGMMNYVFVHLKCNRFTAKPYRKNKKILHLLPRIGFVYEYTMKKYYGADRQEDAIVFAMYREQADRWIDAI